MAPPEFAVPENPWTAFIYGALHAAIALEPHLCDLDCLREGLFVHSDRCWEDRFERVCRRVANKLGVLITNRPL